MPYRGVNLAGAEFGTALPGTEDRDYKWPTSSEVDYFVSKGMNTFRIGFKWERLQPVANGELAGPYLAKLDGARHLRDCEGRDGHPQSSQLRALLR